MLTTNKLRSNKFQILSHKNVVFFLVYLFLLWDALTVLLKASSYPIVSFEALFAYLFFLVLSIILGSFSKMLGEWFFVIACAIALTLLANLLFRPFSNLDWIPVKTIVMPIMIFASVVILSIVLGKQRPVFFVTVSFVMLLASILTPTTRYGWRSEGKLVGSGHSSLPPYIHIILDEHIGIEGILSAYEQKTKTGKGVSDKYLDLDFRVYGRAFSRYKATRNSFRSFMNFEFTPSMVNQNSGRDERNELLSTLTRQGYEIGIIQSQLPDHCKQKTPEFKIAFCLTYPFSPHLDSLIGSSLSTEIKTSVIVSTVFARMGLVGMINNIAESEIGINLGFPKWPIAICLSCIATESVLDDLSALINKIGPGQALIVHLLLPHGPYQSYADNCIPDYSFNYTLGSFDQRYLAYLRQLECTQVTLTDLLGRAMVQEQMKRATVIVHGDHGTRVFRDKQSAFSVDKEKSFQAYSTFFAVHSSNIEPGYDRSPLPLDQLLAQVQNSDVEKIKNETSYLVQYPDSINSIPFFSYGELAEEWKIDNEGQF